MCWDSSVGGRVAAQAVSRWLPTAAARVRVRTACEISGEQSCFGQVFSEYFGFRCQFSTNFSIIIITRGAGTIGLLVAAVPSVPNWTPPPTIQIKKLIKHRANLNFIF
jgi:hypothetical protein